MRLKLFLPFALLTASIAGAQSTKPLTLTNLKAPIAKAAGTAPAKSVAELWKQINGLPAAASAPTPTALPIDTPTSPPLPKPTPSTTTLAGVLDEGDSISAFWGGNHTGIYAAAHPNVTYHANAVGGSQLENNLPTHNDLLSRFDADVALKPAYVSVLIGANDVVQIGENWSQWAGGTDPYLKELFAYTDRWRATGAKLALGTILPQCLPGRDNTVWNKNSDVINSAIRASVGVHVDAVIDYAADPRLQNACDTKVFQADGLHPTDAPGGQAIMAEDYTAAMDGMIAGTTPAPAPTPSSTPTPAATSRPAFVPTAATTQDIAGVSAIPSEFDPTSLLVPSWPVDSMAPDVVGAFRFSCQAGQLNWDDPIKYPGQPGKSPHLHQWFGNTLADGNSTFQSLRTTGDSTCGNKINRSAYWIPAMMDGSTGKVVKPNYVNIYYKRRPDTDPYCTNEAPKGCIALPRGLRYIFGYNMTTGTGAGMAEIQCIKHDYSDVNGIQRTIPDAAKDCPVGASLEIRLTGPNCWKAGQLDSADHMSHMAYASWGSDGKEHCPKDYDYVLPAFTISAFYTNDGTAGTWFLSSDRMPGMPQMAPGTSFHSDWFGAWDDTIMQLWTANCINKMLSCSGGPIGDGRMMRQDLGPPADPFGPTVKVDPPA